MLPEVFKFIQQFIFDGSKFVNFLNEQFGFGNWTILTFFTFSGLVFFLGVAIVKWLTV